MTAIYDWFGYDLPIQERYRLIKAAGFDGVLLWWSEGFGRGDYRSGAQLAREAGLFIENIHAPLQSENNLWLDSVEGEAVASCYRQCVVDCAQFDIPTMVVHLPDEDHPLTPVGLDRMKRMAEQAERLGVNVALENLWNLPNLRTVLEQVDSPRIGFCYDVGHHYRYYPSEDLLARYGSRMMALHLHDIDEVDGDYAPHRLPFDGTIPWPTAMANLAQTGYAGATAVELMNWGYPHLSPEEFLQAAFAQATRLEALRTS